MHLFCLYIMRFIVRPQQLGMLTSLVNSILFSSNSLCGDLPTELNQLMSTPVIFNNAIGTNCTGRPSPEPTLPTMYPTLQPSLLPTHLPTEAPTNGTDKPSAAPTLTLADNCIDHSIVMLDSYGDGWSGTTLHVGGYNFTFSSGYKHVKSVCLYIGKTFSPYTCGGTYLSEVSWRIQTSNGIVASGAGAPCKANTSFVVTAVPTEAPTKAPTSTPSNEPTLALQRYPTNLPTFAPFVLCTISSSLQFTSLSYDSVATSNSATDAFKGTLERIITVLNSTSQISSMSASSDGNTPVRRSRLLSATTDDIVTVSYDIQVAVNSSASIGTAASIASSYSKDIEQSISTGGFNSVFKDEATKRNVTTFMSWDGNITVGTTSYAVENVDYTRDPTTMPSPSPTSEYDLCLFTAMATCAADFSDAPTSAPSNAPSFLPTSSQPTPVPSRLPTGAPTLTPSLIPTKAPTPTPTLLPTRPPTLVPSPSPTSSPTLTPTVVPTRVPSAYPTINIAFKPTPVPTTSGVPSIIPSPGPTVTVRPSGVPTLVPSRLPSLIPSSMPTALPTSLPSALPSAAPTRLPSFAPTRNPSSTPTSTPTIAPTPSPSGLPFPAPSARPSPVPTMACKAGLYLEGNGIGCSICSVGRYSERGATECRQCKAGRYITDDKTAAVLHANESACIYCAAGEFSDAQRSECRTCTSGEYAFNQTECIVCEIGKYAPQALTDACLECKAGGETNKRYGSTACTDCKQDRE